MQAIPLPGQAHHLYSAREGKPDQPLTRQRENNCFSSIQQRCVRAGRANDPWASHKSEIIGSQGRAVNIHHGGAGAAAAAGLELPRPGWELPGTMMSGTSTGRRSLASLTWNHTLTLNCQPRIEMCLSNHYSNTQHTGYSPPPPLPPPPPQFIYLFLYLFICLFVFLGKIKQYKKLLLWGPGMACACCLAIEYSNLRTTATKKI